MTDVFPLREDEIESRALKTMDTPADSSALKLAMPEPLERSLPELIVREPVSQRALWLIALVATLALYALALFTYWAPGDGGIDQNAYLVGGKQIARLGTMRVDLSSPFAYVGAMFILPETSSSYYPKYPFGLPLLYAIAMWIAPAKHEFIWPFAVSPICSIAAVAGMFFLARKVGGSFVALLCAIALATCQVMWLLADVANSHASCLAFVVWGMYALIRWWQRGAIWRGVLAGFLLGYACTIRYTEGLLILPLALVAIDRMRWRDWRSYLRNAAPVIGWLVPVATLIIFNRVSMGAWTGYDSSNESVGFTWEKFTDTWEQMIRTFHDQGLFFLLPFGVIGLVMLFARSWRFATVMLAWLLPGVAVYTAYYWSPDRGVAYARFFLTYFPPLLVGFAACMRFGVMNWSIESEETGRRARRIIPALSAGLIVAIASGVATWRAVDGANDEGPNGWSQTLLGQFRGRATLANTGAILRRHLPDHSILFAEDARGPAGSLNYLQFAGNWTAFASNGFEARGRFGGPRGAAENDPNPMQPHRRAVMAQLLADKSEKDLIAEQNRVTDEAIGAGRRAFILGTQSMIDGFRRKYLPAKKYELEAIARWKDPPERTIDEAAAPPRRIRFTGGGGRPPRLGSIFGEGAELKLVEIKSAQPKPASQPTTSPASAPATTPSN